MGSGKPEKAYGCNKSKILVIGDIMLDQYLAGRSERLCPEAPAPVVIVEDEKWFLGGAGNVASNIRAIGGQVLLAGVVGRDEEGQWIQKNLKSRDIPLVMGVDASRPTTVKKRIMIGDRLIARIDREVCADISDGVFQDIVRIVAAMQDIALVIVSDYGKGVVTRGLMEEVINLCSYRGIPVYVDPKGQDYGKYRGADVIKPNFPAFEAFYGHSINSIEEMQKAGLRIFETVGCKACIVTWEANGAILISSPGQWRHFPGSGKTGTPFVSGAGDAFMAALAMGRLMGLPLESACNLANSMASGVVGEMGTIVMKREKWDEMLGVILLGGPF